MGKNDCRRIPIRFSYDNPEHVKILDTLDDLNLDIHKSKNHFILNAISFYIDAMNSGDLTNAALEKQKEMEKSFVTQEQLDERLSGVAGTIKAELYEDVIRFLGGMMMLPAMSRAGMEQSQPDTSFYKSDDKSDDDNGADNGDITQALGQYDNVLSQVMSWSEDE